MRGIIRLRTGCRYFFLFVAPLIGMPPLAADEPPRDWENPAVFARNTEPPHATFIAYPTEDAAKAQQLGENPWHKSLNGKWKFRWSRTADERPVDFYQPSFDVSGWHDIDVPANWEFGGFDTPVYTNSLYPHPPTPPKVGRLWQPVGSYRRTFEVPADWSGRQVFIHFDGIMSAAYVWINGQMVGYHEDSMTPAEFNISRFIKPGENDIAVEVYRWSDGSYLEDQDMWRLSGIYRDMYLVARPPAHIRDFFVRTEFDDEYRDAELQLAVTVRNLNPTGKEKYWVVAKLYDAEGKQVAGGQIEMPVEVAGGEEPLLDFSAWEYSQEQLERAKHDYELAIRRPDWITVNLDWRQRGVGGVNSWGQPTLRQYTLRGKHFEHKFRLEPIRGE